MVWELTFEGDIPGVDCDCNW